MTSVGVTDSGAPGKAPPQESLGGLSFHVYHPLGVEDVSGL